MILNVKFLWILDGGNLFVFSCVYLELYKYIIVIYFTQELAKIYIMEADSSVDVSAEVSAIVVMSALVNWLQVVCTDIVVR